jgi:predicted DNA-binding transcriptional regulator AlpA
MTTMEPTGPADTATPIPGRVLIGPRTFWTKLALSSATFWRRRAAGKLPDPIKIGGNVLRWRLDEVDAWIDAGCPDRETWNAMRQAACVTCRPAIERR